VIFLNKSGWKTVMLSSNRIYINLKSSYTVATLFCKSKQTLRSIFVLSGVTKGTKNSNSGEWRKEGRDIVNFSA